MAIDAVSDADLLRNVFAGGVFWLSVGKMSNSTGEIKSAMLLEKVQNFIARMDKNHYRPPNLESATDYLQEVMMEQYPQSLLILDDVWEAETADVFAVRCRTLATTRNAEVANGINTPDVYPVPVTEVGHEGFLLGRWLCFRTCVQHSALLHNSKLCSPFSAGQGNVCTKSTSK